LERRFVKLRKNAARSRLAAGIAVIVVHALILVIAVQVRRNACCDPTEDAAMVWLKLDPLPEPQRLEQTAQEEVEAQSAPRAAPPQPNQQLQDTAPEPSTVPSPPRQIDWQLNAARSAETIVRELVEGQNRSRGAARDAEQSGSQSPTLFEALPKHRHGEEGKHVNVDPVVWMNENCYTTLDKPVQTARDWIITGQARFAAPAINCVGGIGGSKINLVLVNLDSFTPPSINYVDAIGKRQANGRLFEHIRKRQEPPLPKAGTETNQLPEPSVP
jgi:hypothetical protein